MSLIQAFLQGLISALTRCMRGVRQTPFLQVASVSSIMLMLLLCGVMRLFAVNIDGVVAALGRNAEMVVYLHEGISEKRVQEIVHVLTRLPGVEKVTPVSQKEAHARLRQSLSDRGDLLDGVEEELLPRSIEVSFRSGVSDIVRVHPFYAKLRQTDGVEDVELMNDWVRRLLSMQRLLSMLCTGLLLLCALATVFVVRSVIRISVYARREEFEVLKLVGATDLHIGTPYLLEGSLQGLLGAALAALLLYLLYTLSLPMIVPLLREIFGEVVPVFLPLWEIFGMLGCGVALGFVCSLSALRRNLGGSG